MALDGLFLHHLIDEIKEFTEGKKIYKIVPINDTNYLFVLSSKTNLLINVTPGNSHIRLTNKEYMQSASLLSVYLKKHIECGIINSIKPYKNDRALIINIYSKDELGYRKEYNLIIELMGKNSNLIITDENLIVLEAIKKSYLTDEHLVKTGVKYKFINDNKINPFEINDNDLYDIESLQGLSKQAINEINNSSLNEFLNRKIIPTLISNNKHIFYFTDLLLIDGNRTYFKTLSELLEYYYDKIQNSLNENQDLIPGDGIINWQLNCEKNNYKGAGYTGTSVCKIPISFDTSIWVLPCIKRSDNICFSLGFKFFIASLKAISESQFLSSFLSPTWSST